MSRGRPRAPLTDRDMETLGELIAAQDSLRDYHARCNRDPATADQSGFAPLQFGGHNGSHHGATATKLAARGLAEHKKRGHPWGEAPKSSRSYDRGSKVYRPTQLGRLAFDQWAAAKLAERAARVGIAQQQDESEADFRKRVGSVERAGERMMREKFPERYK